MPRSLKSIILSKFSRTVIQARALLLFITLCLFTIIFLNLNLKAAQAVSYSARRLSRPEAYTARQAKKAKKAKAKKNNKAASDDVNLANITDKDLRREIAIGRKALAQIEEQWPLTSDPIAQARLTMILNRLEPHMTRKIPYEIRLIKTEVKNAFCLPGGFIFFTTGILKLLKTDAEIAAVMAHEMIHADRKHSLRMAAESNKVTLGALAVMLLSQGAAVPIILAQVAQIAIMNSYTIELEAEADSLGLDALIESGYPPGGMVTLMEKFLNEEMKEPIREYGIYMNHPDSPKRLASAINKLNKLNIPVNRKLPLGLLRTSIQNNNKNNNEKLNLLIDGEVILSLSNTPDNLNILSELKANLDKYLQLELAPYDIHTANNALYIKNSKILSLSSDKNNNVNIEQLKQNLLQSIDRARRKHPAKYFK